MSPKMYYAGRRGIEATLFVITPIATNYAKESRVVVMYGPIDDGEMSMENSFRKGELQHFPDKGECVIALVQSLGFPDTIHLWLETEEYGPTLTEELRIPVELPADLRTEPCVDKALLTYVAPLVPHVVDVVEYEGKKHVFKYPRCFEAYPETTEKRAAIQLEDLPFLLQGRSTHVTSPSHIVFSPIGGSREAYEGFLMPYHPLGTLAEQGRALSWHRRLSCLLDVVRGILDLHSAGIYWGDVRLENICLTDDLEARIIDYAPSSLGSQVYVPEGPPGQWPIPLTAARDVYSLGVLIWAVWNGRNPLGRDRIMSREGLISEWEDETPLRLKNLCQRCLELQPEERPGLLDVGKELEDVIANI